MFRKILYITFILGLYNPSVQAEGDESFYMGIQATQTTYEEEVVGIGSVEVEAGALVLRFGGYVNEGAAVEARVGLGMNGLQDDTTISGTVVEMEVDSLLGLYGLYHVGWGSSASLYGAVGLTNIGMKATVTTPTYLRSSLQETSLSAGIGLNIAGFNIEYMHYLHDIDYDLTAISFGYVSSF